MSNTLETKKNKTFEEHIVQEIKLDNGETQILVNEQLFLDINNQLEDIQIILNYLKQDIRTKFLEKKNKTYFGCC